jgi:hypothetical protein
LFRIQKKKRQGNCAKGKLHVRPTRCSSENGPKWGDIGRGKRNKRNNLNRLNLYSRSTKTAKTKDHVLLSRMKYKYLFYRAQQSTLEDII